MKITALNKMEYMAHAVAATRRHELKSEEILMLRQMARKGALLVDGVNAVKWPLSEDAFRCRMRALNIRFHNPTRLAHFGFETKSPNLNSVDRTCSEIRNREIIKAVKRGEPVKKVAQMYGLSTARVYRILDGFLRTPNGSSAPVKLEAVE